jgi:hypothetical protein
MLIRDISPIYHKKTKEGETGLVLIPVLQGAPFIPIPNTSIENAFFDTIIIYTYTYQFY